MAEETDLGRRKFLKGAIGSIMALIGIGFGLPAIPYIIAPAIKKSEDQNWIALGPIAKIEIGQPTLFKFKIKTQNGWIVDEQEVAAYVITTDGREFTALSNVCTHLGCRVRWIGEQEKFFCPCHNGVFDKQGNVESGPPPRPLDKFEVKVEKDQLLIKGGKA